MGGSFAGAASVPGAAVDYLDVDTEADDSWYNVHASPVKPQAPAPAAKPASASGPGFAAAAHDDYPVAWPSVSDGVDRFLRLVTVRVSGAHGPAGLTAAALGVGGGAAVRAVIPGHEQPQPDQSLFPVDHGAVVSHRERGNVWLFRRGSGGGGRGGRAVNRAPLVCVVMLIFSF